MRPYPKRHTGKHTKQRVSTLTHHTVYHTEARDNKTRRHHESKTHRPNATTPRKLEKEGVDVSLSRGGIGFQDLVRFDITPDVLEKRVPKKDELKKKLAAIPTEALYGFQRVAVELVCQVCISGQPGALVSLDTSTKPCL